MPVPGVAAIERLREGGGERSGLVPLDRNERLSPLPDAILDELRSAIDGPALTEYPILDGAYADLGAAAGLARERLLLTSGSDAAFRALHFAYVRPGDRVTMLDPSYAMYAVYAAMFQAEPAKVPFNADMSLDVDRVLAAVEGSRLVLIANPNQPTGTVLSEEALRAVIDAAAGALVVIDEAYFPFSRTTVLPWVEEHPNLVVTRTFSKAWGLAGLRLGFAAGHPDVIRTLFKVRSVYDIASLSAAALRVVLAHPEVADDYVAEVDAGRAVVSARAAELGLQPLESPTNFMQIRVGHRADPATLTEALAERGFLVKGPAPASCLRDCIRATLGPPALMERFSDALAESLEATAR